MINRRTLLSAALAACTAPRGASAQGGFPAREITFIVPWNAGGSNDILARQLQALLREQGVTIIVENAPGATGTIGMRRVATAAPDGYTVGMGTSSTLALIAQDKTPLRNENFTHIARVSIEPLILLVPAASTFRTPDDFVAHIKANPGKVSIGTPGNYNLNHIFASMTARAAGVDYVNVPYPGGAKVVVDLAGGQIEGAVLKPSESLGQINQGLVRPIGVYADERLAVLPAVPTFKERGIDVFPYGPVVQMAYVVGPANLPGPIRDRLVAAFRTALQDARFKTFAEKNAFLVDDLTGDALTREVESVGSALGKVAAQIFPKDS